jgi:hypothetical protein
MMFSLLLLLPVAALAGPLKVVLLAGQSNMVGQGHIDHLDQLVVAEKNNEYRDALWGDNGYKERDDVFVKFYNYGKLKVDRHSGYAAPDSIGPEIMIGNVLGDAWKDPVLLLKTAWDGCSLAVDFRPPSSGNIGEIVHVGGDPMPRSKGSRYKEMINVIHDTLDHISDYTTANSTEYELTGMIWFQGWNDMLDPKYVEEYGANLANFIRDVRKDLNAPNLPIVIGELGMHGIHPDGKELDRVSSMRAHQEGVTKLDEFAGNTLYVPTAQYVVSNSTRYVPEFHYYGKYHTCW